MPTSTQKTIETAEVLLSQGRVDEAAQCYRDALKNTPERYDVQLNYAAFLYRCGMFEEAAAMAQKSIDTQPSTEGFHNLACAQKAAGNIDAAIENFKKAIHHNPDFTASHNDLATCYQSQNRLEQAIDHFQIAATLSPKSLPYWHNLALARKLAGRYREALSAMRFARGTEVLPPPAYWHDLARIFEHSQDFDINRQLVEEVTGCLGSDAVEPMRLTKICKKLFLHQPIIKTLLDRVEDYEIEGFEDLLKDKTLVWGVFNHSLFTLMLRRLPVQDTDIEGLFTALRRHALLFLEQGRIEHDLWEKSIIFLSALACQCYLNDYIYFETTEEKVIVLKLAEKISSLQNVSDYDIALYACYRSLHTLPNAPEIEERIKGSIMAELARIQITEPMREKNIKREIPALASIEDETSALVKEQYEENPYPHWIEVGFHTSLPLRKVLKTIFPFLKPDDFSAINAENPRTLIAGCGTGKQAIETALIFRNSDILAVDITSASLAYAIRKTQEKGLNEITYAQADILKLGVLEEKFDVIQCVGVLHHMQDPMAGWRVLTDLLKPGGFMLIALYSDIARKPVVHTREMIRRCGLEPTPDGIRECREMIKSLPLDHPAKPCTVWMDFHTMSTCRDLLFHVQEHRFTTPQIAQCLDDLNLEFIGFHLPRPETLHHYRSKFPTDPLGKNLENWNRYEESHPFTFEAMYQFWVRKPIAALTALLLQDFMLFV